MNVSRTHLLDRLAQEAVGRLNELFPFKIIEGAPQELPGCACGRVFFAARMTAHCGDAEPPVNGFHSPPSFLTRPDRQLGGMMIRALEAYWLKSLSITFRLQLYCLALPHRT